MVLPANGGWFHNESAARQLPGRGLRDILASSFCRKDYYEL
jgi:hypothetical protein